MLEVEHLQVIFHTAVGTANAVRDLSFSLKEGEVLGIVGESGSGKSVTSLAIMGLLDEQKAEIVSGAIKFEGKDLLQLNDSKLCRIRGNDIAMIFQEPAMALNPIQKVKKQLREVYKEHMPDQIKDADSEILELLQKLNIADAEHVMNKYPFELSGGIKQRIMIAMAMISKPKLLIADEPTTALDVTTQSEILELLKMMQKETKCAVILITHDLGVIAEMADRVMVMYRGQAVEESEVITFFNEAKHPYSEDLLKARPEYFNGRFNSIAGTIPNAYQEIQGCGYCGRCQYEVEECKHMHLDLISIDEHTKVRCGKYRNEEQR